jgi:two-component system, sensor histidine kinase and response regulator
MSAGEKANILLVDDNPAKQLALASLLEPLGHDLYIAGSGREALRLALQRDYAVILLDVQMPGMDGFETAKLIRERPRSIHTPIIFITAYESAEIEMLRGYSLGAVDYIFAPVNPQVLLAKVGVFVDLAVLRQRLQSEIEERQRAAREIDALNASLRKRAAQLEGANKELESFSYSASHDLRAPLRAISGFARALNEEYADRLDDEGRRFLKLIMDGAQKMGRLIDDLLAFSRFSGRPIAPVEIDMNSLAKSVVGEVVAPKAPNTPEVRISALPRAMGDPALIRQVWTNLLSNSVKYSGKRDQPLIEITGHSEGADQVYCVRDNGAGFDMRQYKKLFGVFQRLHDARQYPGTGVGLAIVQRVVSRHGGRVWAEGKPGAGASFYFSLPRGADVVGQYRSESPR